MGKIGKLGKLRAIYQNFSCQYSDTPKMYLEYALTVTYSPNFSSPIAYTCIVHQTSPAKIFPCTVIKSIPSTYRFSCKIIML